MSFVDEMRKLSADKEKELANRTDKEIASGLGKIKGSISGRIARGEKFPIKDDDTYCCVIESDPPGYVVFNPHVGPLGARIKWHLTEKTKDGLAQLRNAAAEDGITITGFSYVLGNGGGDDSLSYDCDRFYEDHGVLTIPRRYCLYRTIKDPQEWRVYVSCSYTFSV